MHIFIYIYIHALRISMTDDEIHHLGEFSCDANQAMPGESRSQQLWPIEAWQAETAETSAASDRRLVAGLCI